MIAMQLDLPLIFMALMGLAILAYVILDGFDLASGDPAAAGHARGAGHDGGLDRPFWDANETWLVLGVESCWWHFPHAHGVILSSLYLEVAVMLIALILRGVAFESG